MSMNFKKYSVHETYKTYTEPVYL